MLGGFSTDTGVREYNGFQLFDELPAGWRFDKTAGSPVCGYSFATDGNSVLRGGKRALVRVVPPQKSLFDVEVACSKMETIQGRVKCAANAMSRRNDARKMGYLTTMERLIAEIALLVPVYLNATLKIRCITQN